MLLILKSGCVSIASLRNIFGLYCIITHLLRTHDFKFSIFNVFWCILQVDYFVDCHYSGVDDRLWVIGGTGSGTLGYFPVDYNSPASIGSPEAILEGGHSGVVRTVLPVSNVCSSLSHSKGIFGWSGGEDGRLCCWLSDESSQSHRSWITSALVVKSPRSRGKNRHNPY